MYLNIVQLAVSFSSLHVSQDLKAYVALQLLNEKAYVCLVRAWPTIYVVDSAIMAAIIAQPSKAIFLALLIILLSFSKRMCMVSHEYRKGISCSCVKRIW